MLNCKIWSLIQRSLGTTWFGERQ